MRKVYHLSSTNNRGMKLANKRGLWKLNQLLAVAAAAPNVLVLVEHCAANRQQQKAAVINPNQLCIQDKTEAF